MCVQVSTTLNDNPRALQSRPRHVHLVPMPNSFRGRYSGGGSGGDEGGDGHLYANCVARTVACLRAAGNSPAAFIAEPLSGNAGGVELPPGYLRQVYADVRAAGGLCISDEGVVCICVVWVWLELKLRL